MHPSQYGFKKGKSVEDAWYHVKNVGNDSTKKYVLGIFIDFKGAFDNLLWPAIMKRLKELGSSDIKLWRKYFSDREVLAIGKQESISKRVTRGCPQGSICCPEMWNMVLDPLLHSIICEVVAYADDVLLLVEANSRAELERVGTVNVDRES